MSHPYGKECQSELPFPHNLTFRCNKQLVKRQIKGAALFNRVGAMIEDENKEETFTVVKNHEDQYSIWPAGKPLPAGWQEIAKSGSKHECLEYIEHTWLDMRPLSLRRRMEASTS